MFKKATEHITLSQSKNTTLQIMFHYKVIHHEDKKYVEIIGDVFLKKNFQLNLGMFYLLLLLLFRLVMSLD